MARKAKMDVYFSFCLEGALKVMEICEVWGGVKKSREIKWKISWQREQAGSIEWQILLDENVSENDVGG